jgi:hypothetical protein
MAGRHFIFGATVNLRLAPVLSIGAVSLKRGAKLHVYGILQCAPASADCSGDTLRLRLTFSGKCQILGRFLPNFSGMSLSFCHHARRIRSPRFVVDGKHIYFVFANKIKTLLVKAQDLCLEG